MGRKGMVGGDIAVGGEAAEELLAGGAVGSGAAVESEPRAPGVFSQIVPKDLQEVQ